MLKRAGGRIDVSFVDVRGATRQVDYAVPNANQCKECHSLSKEIAPIGVKARNLNGVFPYATGPENQLAHWTRTGLLEGAPAPEKAPRTAVWDNAAEPLEARARAYLDGNCAHCHNARGMASNSGLFLDLEETNPSLIGVGKRPVAAGRGSGNLEFAIAPGQPDASIIVHRMASTEPGGDDARTRPLAGARGRPGPGPRLHREDAAALSPTGHGSARSASPSRRRSGPARAGRRGGPPRRARSGSA